MSVSENPKKSFRSEHTDLAKGGEAKKTRQKQYKKDDFLTDLLKRTSIFKQPPSKATETNESIPSSKKAQVDEKADEKSSAAVSGKTPHRSLRSRLNERTRLEKILFIIVAILTIGLLGVLGFLIFTVNAEDINKNTAVHCKNDSLGDKRKPSYFIEDGDRKYCIDEKDCLFETYHCEVDYKLGANEPFKVEHGVCKDNVCQCKTRAKDNIRILSVYSITRMKCLVHCTKGYHSTKFVAYPGEGFRDKQADTTLSFSNESPASCAKKCNERNSGTNECLSFLFRKKEKECQLLTYNDPVQSYIDNENFIDYCYTGDNNERFCDQRWFITLKPDSKVDRFIYDTSETIDFYKRVCM